MTKPKRPRDTNRLVILIVDLSTGSEEESNTNEYTNPAAVALGRLGDKKGGKG